jgi:hypothetical protein
VAAVFLNSNNNQPKVGICGGRDIGDGMRLWWNVLERHFCIVWGGKIGNKKINKIQSVLALDGHQMTNKKATTN